MSAPKANEAAVAAVQQALNQHTVERIGPIARCAACGFIFTEFDKWDMHRARAAADAAAPHIAAQALRDFADTRGVNVGDEDGDWLTGYRQAQRECLQDAVKAADRIEAGQ